MTDSPTKISKLNANDAHTRSQSSALFFNDKRHDLQSLIVAELEGNDAITIELKGGLIPVIGAGFGMTLRGGKYLPIYSENATQSALSVEYDDTEMECHWDGVFIKAGEVKVTGTDWNDDSPTPEAILSVFQRLLKRGRQCNVQLANFRRVGLLRRVTPKPTRGYLVNPVSGGDVPPGTNLEVVLKWEWSGVGAAATSSIPIVSGDDVAGALSLADANVAAATADLANLFSPDLFESLSDGVTKMRNGINGLRKTVKGIASLAQAPANIAYGALNAAKSLGNVVNDVKNAIADTATEYRYVNAEAGALVDSVSLRLKTGRAVGALRSALDDVSDQVVAVFNAIESRKPRIVGVRPGQHLADVAQKYLGARARWTEIATMNQLPSEVVPDGVFSVQVPGR